MGKFMRGMFLIVLLFCSLGFGQKYWVGLEPNSEITSAEAQALANWADSLADLSAAEIYRILLIGKNQIDSLSIGDLVVDTILYNNTYWDDLRFPANALSPKNQNDAVPEYDTTNVGWLFDDSQTETISGIAQLPHTWVEGTAIGPHVHWEQGAIGVVVWEFRYVWTNIGDTLTSWVTLTDSVGYGTYVDGTMHQMTDFTTTQDSSGKLLSSIMKWKLSRLGGNSGDTYSGDVLMTEFDIHYQINALGSKEEYIK